MRTASGFTSTIAALLAGVVISAQQSPRPLVFRAESNYVELYASPIDRDGRFVPDLRASDFEVREDGRRQTIDVFSSVELPRGGLPATSGTPVAYAPGVAAADRGVDQRLYLIYLGPTDMERIPGIRHLASMFVRDYLLPGDLAAVWDPGRPAREIRFTTDRDFLLRQISPFLGAPLGLDFSESCSSGTVESLPASQRERCRFYLREPRVRLEETLNWFRGIQHRRKSVVLFGASWPGERIGRTTTDVQIYAVAAPGISSTWPYLPQETIEPGVGQPGIKRPVFTTGFSLENLQVLAEESGGFLVRGNDFEREFARIVDHNSRYYVLGYASTYTCRDGDYRELQVKVKRPGVRVYARRGYYAY